MSKPEIPEPMLTPAQVAEWLQINRQSLSRMRMEGRGPRHYSVGAAVRYRRSDVEAWLQEGAA